jgi:hypothetical protein
MPQIRELAQVGRPGISYSPPPAAAFYVKGPDDCITQWVDVTCGIRANGDSQPIQVAEVLDWRLKDTKPKGFYP